MDPFVAEIRVFPFNFAPKGWAFCDGQLLPISQNTALFSLLGTYYGGDGKSTFALPDLQGSAPLDQGQGAGLSDYFIGQSGGSQNVTLLQSEMPIHNHQAQGVATGNQWGSLANGYATTITTTLAPSAITNNGGSQPHNNMQPYLVLNFIIALQGIFPSRN